jgi:hypothetical protein
MIAMSGLWIGGGGQDVFGMELEELLNQPRFTEVRYGVRLLNPDWRSILDHTWCEARVCVLPAGLHPGQPPPQNVMYWQNLININAITLAIRADDRLITHELKKNIFDIFPKPNSTRLVFTILNDQRVELRNSCLISFDDNPTQEMIVNIPGSSFRIEMIANYFSSPTESITFRLRLLLPGLTALTSS